MEGMHLLLHVNPLYHIVVSDLVKEKNHGIIVENLIICFCILYVS